MPLPVTVEGEERTIMKRLCALLFLLATSLPSFAGTLSCSACSCSDLTPQQFTCLNGCSQQHVVTLNEPASTRNNCRTTASLTFYCDSIDGNCTDYFGYWKNSGTCQAVCGPEGCPPTGGLQVPERIQEMTTLKPTCEGAYKRIWDM